MGPDATVRTTDAIVFEGLPHSTDLVGGKGAALDRLVAWGIPVPTTGAVTTDAYRVFARAPAITELAERIRSGASVPAAEVDTIFDSVSFDDDTAARIVDVARRVGNGRRLAVRSSATVEDLADSSFAGQYRSLLDVDPADADATLSAVRSVFASLWHPAPCAYRAAFGIDDRGVAMAAVLMQMVPASRAGVAFTIDPGGEEDMVRVEAVEGLGESLVSGQETPDAWLVHRGAEQFDGPPEIRMAAELALEVERNDGRPQDVEWAFDDETLWIVQARPITVSRNDEDDGFDSAVDVAQLTTAGIGEMLPGVLPPFRWHVAAHLVNEAFAQLLDELGAKPTGRSASAPLVRRVRGRATLDFDALRDLARQMPGGSAEELEIQYFGSQRSGRPTSPSAPTGSRWSMVRHELRSLLVRRRSELDAEIVSHAVEAPDEPIDL
jgi:pyruvate,water dikinase